MQNIEGFIVPITQIIIALGLINVWVIRFKKQTSYRAGGAQNMIQEFQVYGLPVFMVYVVGGLKLIIALAMLLGFMYPMLLVPSAYLLGGLMLGAIVMHMKVNDPLKKTMPAICMGLLALLIILLV